MDFFIVAAFPPFFLARFPEADVAIWLGILIVSLLSFEQIGRNFDGSFMPVFFPRNGF